jgi:iron complex transport system substrate-binding protein
MKKTCNREKAVLLEKRKFLKRISEYLAVFLMVGILAALMLTVFSSCGPAASGTGSKTTGEIRVTDGLGNEVVLEKPAEKVIVFVPSALEIIDALGAMDKVAGVDNWSLDIGEPLAQGFEGFGDFQSLNMEKITAADPDLIIGLVGWADTDTAKLAELGIKLYIVDANTVEEVYTEIENTGKLLGLENEALDLSSELKLGVQEIYGKISGIDQGQKPKVFYEVWNDPLMSAGKGTFINDLIEQCGGINIVAADGLEGWPEYSIESLIKNNPDIIIAPASLAADPQVILGDTRFSEIAAVKNLKVFVVPDNPVSRPSQNIIKGLEMFSKAVHPEIFGQFEEIK